MDRSEFGIQNEAYETKCVPAAWNSDRVFSYYFRRAIIGGKAKGKTLHRRLL
jgi:hypothetical protein